MFWNRKQLKDNAKQILSRTLGKSIGVSVVGGYIETGLMAFVRRLLLLSMSVIFMAFAAFLGGVIVSSVSQFIQNSSFEGDIGTFGFFPSDAYDYYEDKNDIDIPDIPRVPSVPSDNSRVDIPQNRSAFTEEFIIPDFSFDDSSLADEAILPFVALLGISIPVSMFFYFLGVACLILVFGFVIFPLRVGVASFFIESRHSDAKFSLMLSGFAKDRYMRNVRAGFLYWIYLTLWALLFLFPAVIKSYSYSMLPFILAEDPNISAGDAFHMTKLMTKGEKWRIFVLDLSFLGWFFASAITCFTGNILLAPYINAVRTELYSALKEKNARIDSILSDKLQTENPDNQKED